MGALGKLIIWHPFEMIFLKLFWPRTGLVKFLDHGCPKCVQFSEKFFHVWKPEFTDIIFLITPVMY